MACHCCNISMKGAVLPGRNDAEMGPTNLLHTLAYYNEYNERFDLIVIINESCHVITGSLHSLTSNFHVIAGIVPSEIRREAAASKNA